MQATQIEEEIDRKSGKLMPSEWRLYSKTEFNPGETLCIIKLFTSIVIQNIFIFNFYNGFIT